MKYIIESNDVIGYTPKYAMLFGDGYMIQPLEDLEELTADYINEHFGDLQDEAYQRGLDDAWECAKKIAQQWEEDTDTEHRLVIDDSIRVTLDSMTASEAIEKLKAYEEQKANDEIKVGDEVIAYGYRGVVTYVHENLYTVMMHDGSCGNWGRNELKKTGKQHDIDKILEEMKK